MGKHRNHLEYVAEVQDVNPDISILGTFTRMQDRIEVKCLKCGKEWSPKAYQLIQGRGCSVCGHKRAGVKARKTHEQFVEEIKVKHPYIRIIGKYIKGDERIQCECLICGNGMDEVWEPVALDLWSGRGCPRCRDRAETSFPEQAVYYYVKKTLH